MKKCSIAVHHFEMFEHSCEIMFGFMPPFFSPFSPLCRAGGGPCCRSSCLTCRQYPHQMQLLTVRSAQTNIQQLPEPSIQWPVASVVRLFFFFASMIHRAVLTYLQSRDVQCENNFFSSTTSSRWLESSSVEENKMRITFCKQKDTYAPTCLHTIHLNHTFASLNSRILAHLQQMKTSF